MQTFHMLSARKRFVKTARAESFVAVVGCISKVTIHPEGAVVIWLWIHRMQYAVKTLWFFWRLMPMITVRISPFQTCRHRLNDSNQQKASWLKIASARPSCIPDIDSRINKASEAEHL